MTSLRRICIVALAAVAMASITEPAAVARPNIVIILTDDQRADGADRMRIVRERLADHGVTFVNAFVSNSLCCPSRTTLLDRTLLAPHRCLEQPDALRRLGAAFSGLGAERHTIAVALHAAGYRTSFVGKYLNGYVGTTIPPGWDEWRSFSYGWGYFGYTLNLNGRLAKFGHSPKDYSTDVLAGLATDFIRRSATSSRPFFLLFAPAAPHSPATPAPRHAHVESPPPAVPAAEPGRGPRPTSRRTSGGRRDAFNQARARNFRVRPVPLAARRRRRRRPDPRLAARHRKAPGHDRDLHVRQRRRMGRARLFARPEERAARGLDPRAVHRPLRPARRR